MQLYFLINKKKKKRYNSISFLRTKITPLSKKKKKKRTKITPLNISYTYILNTKKREQSSPSLHSKITL